MNHRGAHFIICLVALTAATLASAQTYSGLRQFDGQHKNEIAGNLLGGGNVITGVVFGEACTYTHHFTERWSLSAGEQMQINKWLWSADVMGTYRIPFRRSSLYFDGRVVNNFYTPWSTYEFIGNLSTFWEASHFDVRFGLSFIHYYKYKVKNEYRAFTDAGYSEPPTLTVGLGVNIMEREHPWNLGIFLRNYDQFYYENWNINWGVRFHATLPWQSMKLFGELNVRPAGSLSQLATRYETSLKLGVKHVW